MTTLAPLTEQERLDMQEELDLTRRIRAGYVIRLRRDLLAGRPTEKLAAQVASCDRHIERFERELAT